MTPAGGVPQDEWPTPSQPPPAVRVLADVLSQPETVGFVHVAHGDDPDRRYLTRDPEPQQPAAIVCLQTDDDDITALYGVTASHREAAVESFLTSNTADDSEQAPDTIEKFVSTRDAGTPPGRHAVEILADRLGDTAGTGTLRVPSHLPHDAAVRLQQAGYELSSTPVLTDVRAVKLPAERECLRSVQQAAAHGVAHATSQLAAATTDDGGSYTDGEPLSATRLERGVAAAIADTGVTPATVTVTTPGTDSRAPLPTGVGVIIHVTPRGPHGYYGRLTRTVVVESDGGWDRRAHIAANAGLTAARTHCQPETSITTVAAEARAELTAYGFPPLGNSGDTDDDEQQATAGSTATVHGIGLAPVEAPTQPGSTTLTSGSILAIEIAVTDPDHGHLRLGSLIEVTDEGGDFLVAHPLTMTPDSSV